MKLASLLVVGLMVAPAHALTDARENNKMIRAAHVAPLMDKIDAAITSAVGQGKFETFVSYEGYSNAVAMDAMRELFGKHYLVDGYGHGLWIKWN